MLSGRFANDPVYIKENSNGIAVVARRLFNERTIYEMVDPRLMEETHENTVNLHKGPDPHSLDAFSKTAYQCVAERQAERPIAKVIIKKLEELLSFQVTLYIFQRILKIFLIWVLHPLIYKRNEGFFMLVCNT